MKRITQSRINSHPGSRICRPSGPRGQEININWAKPQFACKPNTASCTVARYLEPPLGCASIIIRYVYIGTTLKRNLFDTHWRPHSIKTIPSKRDEGALIRSNPVPVCTNVNLANGKRGDSRTHAHRTMRLHLVVFLSRRTEGNIGKLEKT